MPKIQTKGSMDLTCRPQKATFTKSVVGIVKENGGFLYNFGGPANECFSVSI